MQFPTEDGLKLSSLTDGADVFSVVKADGTPVFSINTATGQAALTGSLAINNAPVANKAVVLAFANNGGFTIKNNSVTIVPFTETVDSENAFTANAFTAPRTGYYLVNASVSYASGSWTAGKINQVFIYVGANPILSNFDIIESAVTNVQQISISGVVKMNATEVLTIRALQTSGASKVFVAAPTGYLTIKEL